MPGPGRQPNCLNWPWAAAQVGFEWWVTLVLPGPMVLRELSAIVGDGHRLVREATADHHCQKHRLARGTDRGHPAVGRQKRTDRKEEARQHHRRGERSKHQRGRQPLEHQSRVGQGAIHGHQRPRTVRPESRGRQHLEKAPVSKLRDRRSSTSRRSQTKQWQEHLMEQR